MCKKGFSTSSFLKEHTRVHTKEKPYVCEVCNKAFSQANILKSHVWTHTKEKPYVCEVCNKGFSQNRQLKTHLWAHTKEKPYVYYERFNLADRKRRAADRVNLKRSKYHLRCSLAGVKNAGKSQPEEAVNTTFAAD
ncbi:zinc finger protein 112 [Trichonephila clavipes]|nr:zinc finger protein 112 [Trichonephila clavipes]